MVGCLGTGIGVAAILTGSPVFILVRILKHSSAWTQIACRSVFFIPVRQAAHHLPRLTTMSPVYH